ncbi:MAG: menaquinone biosynthesis protein [Bacteroidales bacterium]|nr:menaquinone biosynthesis protein [Bacteroidales bacterium]
MNKIKISAVSYLNTFPFLYGIQRNENLNDLIEISTDYPAICAQKLKQNIVDIGLVPIAILPEIADYQIISDYCIAAIGEVKSVLLVSDVPINEIKTVLLDYQSRTSIMLAKILAQNFWKISPFWEKADEDYLRKVKGHTAGVVIGDRALNVLNNYDFVYDLSAEWEKFTKLPFVFATWTANKNIPQEIVNELNNAFKFGIENVDETLLFFKNRVSEINFDAKVYLTEYIDYKLDRNKNEAISKYLSLLSEISSDNSTLRT